MSEDPKQTWIGSYNIRQLIMIDCDNINTNLNGLNFKSNQDSNNNNDLITTDNLVSEGIVEGKGSNHKETVNANSFGKNFDKDFGVFCNNFNNNERVGGEVTGPQGPQGEQGPAGITEINSANFYCVTGNIANVVPGDPMTISRASCDTGDTAISGGYRSNQVDQILFEREDIDTCATVVVGGSSSDFVQTTVYCFDNPPLRP